MEISSSYGNYLQKWNQPFTCSVLLLTTSVDLDDQAPHRLILYHQAMVKDYTLSYSISSVLQSQSIELTESCSSFSKGGQKIIHPLQTEKRQHCPTVVSTSFRSRYQSAIHDKKSTTCHMEHPQPWLAKTTSKHNQNKLTYDGFDSVSCSFQDIQDLHQCDLAIYRFIQTR